MGDTGLLGLVEGFFQETSGESFFVPALTQYTGPDTALSPLALRVSSARHPISTLSLAQSTSPGVRNRRRLITALVAAKTGYPDYKVTTKRRRRGQER